MEFLSANDSSRLSVQAAQAIRDAFDSYQSDFRSITCRSKTHFEQRDWHASHSDAILRLELYKKIIDRIVTDEQKLLGDLAKDRALWAEMKSAYSRLIDSRDDIELAETFFNSVTRRIFTTVGVDPAIEFTGADFEAFPARPRMAGEDPIYRTYPLMEGRRRTPLEQVTAEVFSDYAFSVPYQDAERDTRRLAAEIDSHLKIQGRPHEFERIELLRPVFYRNNMAFIIGRFCGTNTHPLILCLMNTPSGICTDAVLLDEDEASIVFSFTRSYFHVEVDQPHRLVDFLKSIMPLKRIAELYISIGYNKHGKTELYRDLLRHLDRSVDQFEIARGERGMVMAVFTLPSFDMVFKVIKDRVDPPKTTSRKEVMERYDLVFKHDRAGRLVDAQEFEYLSFERKRFSEDLLELLQSSAPSMVTVSEDCVAIKHLYVERRLTPLNLYVKEAGETAARSAVIDYGQAIKDLAATNIFPGDVLLKNFGVTRHGRVVFYDYDELCLVTDCKFRRIPQARDFDSEFEAEPWFYVGPMDIFPEEFSTFLGLQEPLRSLFTGHHGDLFGVSFWKGMQAQHLAGEVVDIFPYPESKHLYRLKLENV